MGLRAIRSESGIERAGRAALLEAILDAESARELAQLVVDYLHRHARVRQIICLGPSDERTGCLVGLAGRGSPASRIEELAVDLVARDHPLLEVVSTDRPRMAVVRELADLFIDGRCNVTPAPLRLPPGADPVALLLTSVDGDTRDEVAWVASLLGKQLVRFQEIARLSSLRRRLERERGFLQPILTAFPDPVLLTDLEGRLLVANPRAEHFFATQEGQSEGRRGAIALNNMLFSAGLSSTAMDGTEAIRRELPLVDPTDGSDRLFELISTAVDTPTGPGVVSVLRNVTDLQLATQEIAENFRKLRIAEADVRAERDRLDLVIDSVGAPILVTDPNGAMVLLNTPAERLFTPSEDARPDVLQRVRANHAHFSSHISNVFFAAPTTRVHGELGLVDPVSGEPAPVEAVSGKVLSEHGEVTALVSILHDLRESKEKQQLYEQLKLASGQLEQKVHDATTELVRQNELLRRQHIELEQASNLKSQFLATMSHEFRTPLNAILGYTSMLLENVSGVLTPPQARTAGRIDSNARHLLAIINDILDISRIEAGSMPTRIDGFELRALVAEVLAEVEPLIARSRVSVRTRFGRSPRRFRSDRAKVKQILVNLLSNALKFTPEGTVTVSCSYAKKSRTISISVTDTGIGIAKEDHERIFEDFRQADSSPTRQYGGAGLGLAISRRLAVVLGGSLSVQSAPKRGSTFTLALPSRSRGGA
jgi:signal transduction histidine kinase